MVGSRGPLEADDSMSRYPLFKRERIQLEPLQRRRHDLTACACIRLDHPHDPASAGGETPGANFDHPEWDDFLGRLFEARCQGRPVLLFLGAHVIKLGLSRFLIDLMERKLIAHVATNGAGIIHDFELALVGGTSEDVAHYIKAGRFGMWEETGRVNEVAREAAERGEGLGEAIGRTIHEERFPHRDLSLCAAAWRLGVPLTSHVSIGSDIIHAHPNCDGAALGAASYTDFLIFARSVELLEGGAFLNFGSAVTGPEVYLKALSMARNVARQDGRSIQRLTTAVFDLVELPSGYRNGTPDKAHPQYYYRPWKTILVRTVAEGGQSYYFQGDHRTTIPALQEGLVRLARGRERADPKRVSTTPAHSPKLVKPKAGGGDRRPEAIG